MSWYDIEDEIYTEFDKLKIKYEDDFKVFLQEDVQGFLKYTEMGGWLRDLQDISILCEKACENDPALIAKVIFNLIYQELILAQMVRLISAKYKAIIEAKYPDYKNIIEFYIRTNILKYVLPGLNCAKIELRFNQTISKEPWYRKYNKLSLHSSNMWTVAEALQNSQADLIINELPVSFEILDWTNNTTNSMHDILPTEIGLELKMNFFDNIKAMIA